MTRYLPSSRELVLAVGIVAGQLTVAPQVMSATFYVATSGNNSNAGSASAPFQTIQKGLSVLSPGDTLVIRDGAYSGSSNGLRSLPNGAVGNYITIRAENEGNVIITAGLDMADDDSYLLFQGLRFHDSSGRTIRGHHLKFFRNEFKGGCATGNCMNTVVGTNDVTTTADILLEDNWFHGSGGRYNLLVYNSSRVVVRRAVIRHDGGWTDNGSQDPEAGLNFYNTRDSAVQNVIVVDSNLNYSTWTASFYAVQNSSSPTPNQNNTWEGCIALVGANVGFVHDTASSTGNTIRDCVFWDTVNGAISLGTGGVGNIVINGVTLGRSKLAASGGFKGGIGKWGSGTPTITNSVVANWTTGSDLDGVSATYFDTFNNGSTSSGTGRVTYSPFTNGLLYLPRIEAGSALKTAGWGGGQIGAQIVNRIGTAGTLRGEAGWNTDTGTALWPFPNEVRIKKEMCTDAGVTRGFCSDTSLTNYIMNYLGKGNPYGSNSLPPPTNLRVQ